MIWTSKHLQAEQLEIQKSIFAHVIPATKIQIETSKKYVTIVGGGPKGFYALERLLTHLITTYSIEPIEIHWFNTNTYFACGQNYRTDQPDNLLVNYAIGNISAWETESDEQCIADRKNLTDWIRTYKQRGTRKVDERDFASRELVGHYLLDCLYHTMQVVPAHITLHLANESIVDIEDHQDGYRLYSDTAKLPFNYQSLILVTGNNYKNHTFHNEQIPNTLSYFNSAYPIQILDSIPDAAEVAIQGYGLTFIDVALHLTEGRGGEFVYRNDELCYQPSGREVIMYPFSRTNLLMLPRQGTLEGEQYNLEFITDEWIENLPKDQKPDFQKNVVPVLEREVEYAFYSVLWKEKNLSKMQIIQRLDSDKIEKPFTIYQLFTPNKDLAYIQLTYYHEFITDILYYIISEIKKDPTESPIAQAVQACRASLLQMPKIYNFCGLDGKSQAYFEKTWLGNMNRLSFGPPLTNIEKIYSLMKAGLIQCRYGTLPKLTFNDTGLGITNEVFTKTFTYFIDGRVAKSQLSHSNSVLYDNLFKRGIVTELVNDEYHTGAIVVNPDGTIPGLTERPIYVYGTATEGNVLDNDTLSRKVYNFGNNWAKWTAEQIGKKPHLTYESDIQIR